MGEDKRLIDEAWAFVDEVWEDVVSDIDYLVQVESVEDLDHATPGAPFGPAPREAMDRALEVARRLGLDAWDCDGYVGCADLPGASDTYLATIAHSDIVPLGKGWTVDPLHVTRREGYLLGRGVIDDKGPLVLSLYAAHFFRRKLQQGESPLPYTLRCIIGANEETHMADVDHYLKCCPQPAFCFSPDAMFPLICGEKGRFEGFVCSRAIEDGTGVIVSMVAAEATNAIPGLASAVIRAQASTMPPSEDVCLEDAGVDETGCALARVIAQGRGGHAAMPEGTRNALGILVRYLLHVGACDGAERDFLEFQRDLLSDSAGQGLGVATEEPCLGALTCVGGLVRMKGRDGTHRLVQSIDMRYPMSASGERIAQRVAEVASAHGCELEEWSDAKPFYVAPESLEIQALLTSYWDVTGRDGDAFTIGGGTYARHFDHAVAFGPMDEADPMPEWVGPEHGADEGVAEDTLRRGLVVYILAIARLMRLAL